MNQATREMNVNGKQETLYMALELAQKKWVVVFGDGVKVRQVTIEAKEVQKTLPEEIKKAKEKFGFSEKAEVISCYEAGRDGFWIQRYLETMKIKNMVIDSSSIEVNRKKRRAKTDRIDGNKLLMHLILHEQKFKKLQIARVPSEAEEDQRRLHRERERIKKEKTAHTNRIRSLLNLQGIKCEGRKKWKQYLEEVRDWKGEKLPANLQEELEREVERLEVTEKQLKELEAKMLEKIKASDEPIYKKVNELKELKGIGGVGAWVLVMEWFGWRKFKNRREVGSAAGLVGTPYSSGESQKEQGITKAGNARIRVLMVQISWSWLRYQPKSELAKWFHDRFEGGKRSRRVGIIALARKLLIAIWRYVTMGEIPKGAELKA